jgi:hypothetical protein
MMREEVVMKTGQYTSLEPSPNRQQARAEHSSALIALLFVVKSSCHATLRP